MEHVQYIASRLREVILNGTWIANTNFKNELSSLSQEAAVARLHSLNTIAELAQHIHYYLAGIKDVLKGGDLKIKDIYSFDFPPIQSQEEWNGFLARFWDDAEEFARLLEELPEERLREAFVDEKYGTYERNLEGLIEHSYYHLGQIVLIKKMLSNRGQ